jgi:dGTPase
MFDHVYLGPVATREHAKIHGVITTLFGHYCAHPDQIPASIPDGELATRVTDHIAGMTDRFCIRTYEDLTVPDAFVAP